MNISISGHARRVHEWIYDNTLRHIYYYYQLLYHIHKIFFKKKVETDGRDLCFSLVGWHGGVSLRVFQKDGVLTCGAITHHAKKQNWGATYYPYCPLQKGGCWCDGRGIKEDFEKIRDTDKDIFSLLEKEYYFHILRGWIA